ncbi:hypothetical protein M8J77_020715 [Diaphorina citri]|nr:hypothetical protein M8J77_020715 [Diaphorina citri]
MQNETVEPDIGFSSWLEELEIEIKEEIIFIVPSQWQSQRTIPITIRAERTIVMESAVPRKSDLNPTWESAPNSPEILDFPRSTIYPTTDN